MYFDGLLEVIRASTRRVRAVEDTQTVSNLPLSSKFSLSPASVEEGRD